MFDLGNSIGCMLDLGLSNQCMFDDDGLDYLRDDLEQRSRSRLGSATV